MSLLRLGFRLPCTRFGFLGLGVSLLRLVFRLPCTRLGFLSLGVSLLRLGFRLPCTRFGFLGLGVSLLRLGFRPPCTRFGFLGFNLNLLSFGLKLFVIMSRKHCQTQSVFCIKSGVYSMKNIVVCGFLSNYCVIRADTSQDVVQRKGNFSCYQFFRLLKPNRLDTVETIILRKKRKQLRRDRTLMSGVEIKIMGSDDNIFWIRRFQNQQASWFQYAKSLLHQNLKIGKGEMFYNMES